MLFVGIILLILFQVVGVFLSRIFYLPIPGGVIGMVFLFITLLFQRSLYQYVAKPAHLLIKWMSLFFIPAGVGVITVLDQVKTSFLPLVTVLTLGTLITMFVTAWAFHFARRWVNEN